MRSHLILLVLVSSTAFGQSRTGFPYCALKLRSMNYFQLVREVDLIRQEEKIDSLYAVLEKARLSTEGVKETIDLLNEQSEEMRRHMQELIEEMSRPDYTIEKVDVDPETAKDPRVAEQLQKMEKLSTRVEEALRLGTMAPVEIQEMEEEYRRMELELKELIKQIEEEKPKGKDD